jgi:energy-coupling factor transporter ATP-binding protein EcfA2
VLTTLTIRNFKKFDEAKIDLGKSVVFVGPNNSGKTTALQALALWEIGLRSWRAKRGGKSSPEKRPGVAINRKDLIAVPAPAANLLWHNLHVRDVEKKGNGEGKTETRTKNIRVDVVVDGITSDVPWSCGFEFDYQNEESFICRPIRQPGFEKSPVGDAKFTQIPESLGEVRVAFLPPMSGLADREFIKESGEIGFLIGQGQTAQVLRNLCLQVYRQEKKSGWSDISARIQKLFGIDLLEPEYYAERSEIIMGYKEHDVRLDLSSAGRGLQQTLLLLAHMYANPNTVLLLDEPDAHLEIIRQRQTYQLLTEIAEAQKCQIIVATHSEVVLNEAAGRGKVVAFVGRPHTMNDRKSQVEKSLTDIGWELYFQAEEKGWMLFLEGPSDLAILRNFAQSLNHVQAVEALANPFVHYVSTNLPRKAEDLFYGLREAKADLIGIAIFDRLASPLQDNQELREMMWSRRELENYFCQESVLLQFAKGSASDLFAMAHADRRLASMKKAIEEVTHLLAIDEKDPWSGDVKATDDVLDRVFRLFFKELNLPLQFRKSDYHELAALLPAAQIDPEITTKLDAIAEVAQRAERQKTNEI